MQSEFRKGRGTRNQIANISWIIEQAKEFQKKKNIYFGFTDYTEALSVWITANCGKLFKEMRVQITLPVSWKICIWVKKQQLEPDME